MLLFVGSLTAFSQNQRFSVELNYPYPVGDHFIAENYNGIIEAGFKYYTFSLRPVKLGISINGGYIKDSEGDRFDPFYVDLYTIQPRLFGELHVEALRRFHPSVGVGYSFFIFNTLPNYGFGGEGTPEAEGSVITEKGLNLNVGLSYDISTRFFVQVQYDFVKLNAEGEVLDMPYNTNIAFLKAGFGYRF